MKKIRAEQAKKVYIFRNLSTIHASGLSPIFREDIRIKS